MQGAPWQSKQVEAARLALQKRLDVALEQGIAARLAYALEQIVLIEQEPFTAESQLERLLFIISALAHHARWGGLSDRDANELHNLAEAILLTHGVDKCTSTLSVLWGELFVAKSQILRLQGKTFASMWEQHLAHLVSRRSPVGTPAFHSLAAGLRALRLGMLDVAVTALSRAEAGALPDRNREQARLARIQALRLSGREGEAQELLTAMLKNPETSPVAARDAAWEGFVLKAVATGELEPMMQAISARGQHRHATFLLEGFLWARSVKARQYEERTQGIRTIRKACGELLTRTEAFKISFEACRNLDDAYDPDRPLAMRVKAVGASLGETERLPSLDKELLVRAAAFRWLLRAKQLEFAAFVFASYESRCLQLSAGRSRDVMGLMRDIDAEALLESYVAPALRSAS